MATPFFPRAAVIGAGTMGNGIAQTFAAFGTEVMLIDLDELALKRGMSSIDKSLARMVKKSAISETEAGAISGRIQESTEIEAVEAVPLVIEAVIERLEVKAEVLASLDTYLEEFTANAEAAGYEVREEQFTRFEVYTADECFLTGTAAEAIPVVKVDQRQIGTGKPGPVTLELIERFRARTSLEGVTVPPVTRKRRAAKKK